MQVLKHNRVGASVEKIKKDNRLDRDVFENILDKKPSSPQRHSDDSCDPGFVVLIVK